MLTIAERFWSKVRKSDACWEWTARLKPDGYGMMPTGGTHREVRAHRMAYELTVGAIPPGLLVCHHCDNRRCVRPDHLFLGTHKDNAQDCVRKGRSRNGHKGVTHCKRGHEFTPENTRLVRHGRQCKACEKVLWRQAYERRRQRAA